MNKEIKYKCKKCGCEKIYSKPNGRRMGIYCIDCGSWICWTKYSTMIEIYKNISDDDLGDRLAKRKIYKRNGITNMKCSKCMCLLYDSRYPKTMGQFNLVDASYCPRCGRELI